MSQKLKEQRMSRAVRASQGTLKTQRLPRKGSTGAGQKSADRGPAVSELENLKSESEIPALPADSHSQDETESGNESKIHFRQQRHQRKSSNLELGGCETPWDSTAQPQPTRINYCDYYSPLDEPTPQEWRLAERRRKVKKRAYLKAMGILKRSGRSFDHKSCREIQERIMQNFQDAESESESETPSLPAASHSQDEMESGIEIRDAEGIQAPNFCCATLGSQSYRFEMTLTGGPENQEEVLDRHEFRTHFRVHNDEESESEEDRAASYDDTHHDAHAGLRAELEFDQRERAIAEHDYAAEQESCQPQSDSPPHASMVECNFALTEEEEEWVQDHAEYDDSASNLSHSDCEDFEDFEDFALTEEEDDWVFGT